jgi:hypothetical protein
MNGRERTSTPTQPSRYRASDSVRITLLKAARGRRNEGSRTSSVHTLPRQRLDYRCADRQTGWDLVRQKRRHRIHLETTVFITWCTPKVEACKDEP